MSVANPARIIAPDLGAKATRVLAIHVTRIGDTILGTPALRAIAAHFPNARLTALGHPKRVEVLAGLPYLAKVGAIDKRRAPFRGWKDVAMGAEYDWAFVWGEDAALVRYALRKARHVVAARQADKRLNARLFAAATLPRRDDVHALAWTLALPAAAGIAARGLALDVAVSESESTVAAQRLTARGIGGARPLIGLQVASFPTKPYRDWPICHFAAMAQQVLSVRPAARFVCFGGPDDAARVNELVASLDGRAVSFAGACTLRETLGLMAHLDAYVGVDTGPTHLFGAFGKPMVALYHPALPSARFRPLEHPCLWALDHPKAGTTRDESIPIGDIGVDRVTRALLDALDGRPSDAPGLPAAGLIEGAPRHLAV